MAYAMLQAAQEGRAGTARLQVLRAQGGELPGKGAHPGGSQEGIPQACSFTASASMVALQFNYY